MLLPSWNYWMVQRRSLLYTKESGNYLVGRYGISLAEMGVSPLGVPPPQKPFDLFPVLDGLSIRWGMRRLSNCYLPV